MLLPAPDCKAVNELSVIPSGKGVDRRSLPCGIWQPRGWTVLRYWYLQWRGLHGWWWDCLYWLTFQLGHRGEVCINTRPVRVCICLPVCDSSVCVGGGSGPSQVGSPEARGSSRQWLGFGVGHALQSLPISLRPPCDIQKTAVAIGLVCVHIRYAYTWAHTHIHTQTHTQPWLIANKTSLCAQAFLAINYLTN